MIKIITDEKTVGLANYIRDKDADVEKIKGALKSIGCSIGLACLELLQNSKTKKIITPMNHTYEGPMSSIPRSVVITTKDDASTIGNGIATALGTTDMGYMDFHGNRGLQALTAPVRDARFPILDKHRIELVVIGKSVLATGCTAISLAKNAISQYVPERLLIASIFYSKSGLADLTSEFPNADIILVGGDDNIDQNGMLIPGVGNLDQRLSQKGGQYVQGRDL